MATRAQREALRRAEREALEAMSTEELEAIVASYPPDPAFDLAIKLLSTAELDMVLDGKLSRKRAIALAKGRKAPPS